MNKRIGIVLSFCLFSISLFACTMNDLNEKEHSGNNVGIESFQPNTQGYINQVKINKEDIYYTAELSRNQAQFPYNTKIYQYNTMTQMNEEIMSLDFEKYGYIAELCATNDYIFFTSEKIAENSSGIDIWKYKISEKKLDKIYTHKYPVVMACEDSYLAWYEVIEYVEEDSSAENIIEIPSSIKIYFTETNEIRTVPTQTEILSPYQRIRIIDGTITFFTKTKDYKIWVNQYDISTNKVITKIAGGQVGNKAMGNEKYLVWSENPRYNEVEIKVYNKQKNTQSFLSSKALGGFDNYDLRNDRLYLFKNKAIDIINLETMDTMNIFTTEGILSYGIGSGDGFALSLNYKGENSIIYWREIQE